MKLKNYIFGKIKRNLILFVLIILGLFTSSLGFYYNLIRETKTTYHYAFRDSKDKTQSLFFQRNTDRNEDKNIIKSIFTYKKGSILNFSNNQVFYITDDNKFDQIKMYDFDTNTSSFLLQNESKKILKDIYLVENSLLILTNNEIIILNLQNKDLNKLEIKNLGNFNEFFNKVGDEVYLRYDNCKFIIETCYHSDSAELLSVNLKSSETTNLKISEVSQEILNKPYFGTNKIFKLGTLKKYTNDEGNKNYNFRIFTQF